MDLDLLLQHFYLYLYRRKLTSYKCLRCCVNFPALSTLRSCLNWTENFYFVSGSKDRYEMYNFWTAFDHIYCKRFLCHLLSFNWTKRFLRLCRCHQTLSKLHFIACYISISCWLAHERDWVCKTHGTQTDFLLCLRGLPII